MKALIVEDQIASGLALGRVLEQLGHEPRIVSSGIAARDLLQAEDWRLVITDWMMPELDGLDLCRWIRARHGLPYIYVILLTARVQRDDRLEGLAAGADDFLAKPVDEAELAVRLAIACRILDMQTTMEEMNARLAELATTDSLTGLANRRRLFESLDVAMAVRGRRDVEYSLMMFDVDHFKSYNDSFGHPSGDEALLHVARLLRKVTRPEDLAARYGGEEFAVLLASTNADQAMIAAERMRAIFEKGPWPYRPITASFGIATMDDGTRPSTVKDLVRDEPENFLGWQSVGNL